MTTTPLATVSDFLGFGSNQELVQNETIWTAAALETLMVRSTSVIQSRTQRRLSPFTAKVESHEAFGISPDEYDQQGSLPMDLAGALGWSQAASMGVTSMVREFWLDETAPMYGEMWTYNLRTVEILRTFGDTQTFSGNDFISWQGPEIDTGHVKMPIGTYCPVGSTIRVTYDGGYNPIPDDLNLACVLQAVKFVLVGAEPEARQAMSSAELDTELLLLLEPYARS